MDFQQAEKKFKQLKAGYEAGELSEAEFKTQLEELMVQDEAGSWWMIGYETEQWYRNDGEDWVQAQPPASLTQNTTRFSTWAPVLWIMGGFAVGWLTGGLVVRVFLVVIGDFGWLGPWVPASAIGGGLGGYVTGMTLQINQHLQHRKSVLWITLGWAAGAALDALVGGIFEPIGWGIGGLVMAITLNRENSLPDRSSLLWIPLAWAVAIVIGKAIDPPFVGEIRGALGWGITGGIGGFVSIWQLKKR
jgi:hypothetical protein